MAQKIIILSGKIIRIQEEIKQLENKSKRLIQERKEQERKDRTKRLCRRMGLIESMLPDIVLLSDDLFKIFLEKVLLTDNSRRILDGLTAQNPSAISRQTAGLAAQGIPVPTTKNDKTEQRYGKDTNADDGNIKQIEG